MSTPVTIFFFVIIFLSLITCVCCAMACIWNKCKTKKNNDIEWTEVEQNSENSYFCFESDPVTI